jgi:hypothetical protein
MSQRTDVLYCVITVMAYACRSSDLARSMFQYFHDGANYTPSLDDPKEDAVLVEMKGPVAGVVRGAGGFENRAAWNRRPDVRAVAIGSKKGRYCKRGSQLPIHVRAIE